MSRHLVRILMLVASFSFAHIAVAQCPFNDPVMQTIEAPILSTVPIGPNGHVNGDVKGLAAIGRTVEFCVVRAGAQGAQITPTQVDPIGHFVAKSAALDQGDRITARWVDMIRGVPTYSPTSNTITVFGVCIPKLANKPKPKIGPAKDGEITVSLSGKAEAGARRFQVCSADHLEIGTFDVFSSPYSATVKAKAKDQIYLNELDNAGTTLATSGLATVQKGETNPRGYEVVLIGGFETAGYSSQSLTSNAFVQGFITESIPTRLRLEGWERVRLLGTASPTTNGIGSAFNDPTGAVTKQSFDTVGQALDYSLGVNWTHWKIRENTLGIVAGFGATTPLSSQTPTSVFVAPEANTYECAEMRSRFTREKGYFDIGLGDKLTNPSCFVAADKTTPITNIAFTGEDRSSFLLKWGLGVRATGRENCSVPPCSSATALLDLTFGQDEAITRGQLRHFVFKADGIIPIPTGDASYIYIFGSAYTRLQKSDAVPPLILAAANDKPTIPGAGVLVLPYKQPDRDFFRLGVGLNLAQIFCKLSGAGCEKD